MGFFGLIKKRFKKRIRLKRRWLALGSALLVLSGLVAYASAGRSGEDASIGERAAAVFSFRGALPETPADLREEAAVTHRRLFVCGEDDKALGVMAPERIARLAAEHPEWEFQAVSAGSVVFVEHVDDLSESCKKNAFFGLDANGNLTLFDGPPREERAVKTFFQLNIEHLESALPEETVRRLRGGIRVTDIAEYNSVLSTFSEFAIDETEKVMKPGM